MSAGGGARKTFYVSDQYKKQKQIVQAATWSNQQ